MEHVLLGAVLLLRHLGEALDLVEPLLDDLEVRYDDLHLDRLHVAHGVYACVDMGHVGALEAPDHVGDGVDLPDLAEEPVAQALTLVRVLHEAGDVDELYGGGRDFLGLR